jgi:hypothetical protein
MIMPVLKPSILTSHPFMILFFFFCKRSRILQGVEIAGSREEELLRDVASHFTLKIDFH